MNGLRSPWNITKLYYAFDAANMTHLTIHQLDL
jgi:hypothetical protein